jgi:hypothetical protein
MQAMSTREGPNQFASSSIDQLQALIQRKTWGRIKNLHVFILDERIVVEGLAPSFHVKQLAIHAVRSVLPESELFFEVDVATPPPSAFATMEI